MVNLVLKCHIQGSAINVIADENNNFDLTASMQPLKHRTQKLIVQHQVIGKMVHPCFKIYQAPFLFE